MWTDSLIRIEAPEPSITLLVVTDCDVSERFLRSRMSSTMYSVPCSDTIPELVLFSGIHVVQSTAPSKSLPADR